jgi:hypothetical protein
VNCTKQRNKKEGKNVQGNKGRRRGEKRKE